MTKEQRAKLRNAAEDAKNAGKPCAECAGVLPAHLEACSKYVKPAVNLDDPEQQERILNPQPADLTIGGEVVHLYPLPARPSRKFVALFTRVMNASAGVVAPMSIRIGTALENDDALSAEVCRAIARAEYAPGVEIDEIDEAALDERARQIGDAATFDEYRDALDRMCDLNRLAEIISGPKATAASAKPTS